MLRFCCRFSTKLKKVANMDRLRSRLKRFLPALQASLIVLGLLAGGDAAFAAVVEFNNTGGSTATNGLHFYIEDTTHIQVRRLNNTGQVYSPTATPASTSLDNGVFLRANNLVYGPSHSVGGGFAPTGGMYNTFNITAASPANPTTSGVLQTATNNLGITNGPQVSIVWKYTTPLDFITAEVTLTIPAAYAVSVANPVRYYHVFDTYLGGSDSGCGVNVAGTSRIVGTYSAPCGSSTSLPASGIVESFRERSGTFSSYCAAGWQSFFVNGGVNCSVLQAASLSKTITTTLQDTGIGIEYDFTSAGTYTFSYDFVIGSTTVPAYDHIEIVHDGSGTLCPETLKVLACTSSTVPCPALSIVNTGTITGNLTVTPANAGISFTPNSFSIGAPASGGTTASVVLQASAAAAGTYALGSSNISGTPPLNGTKCWNGSSASCTFVIANTPCVANFECMETGLTYNNQTPPPAARNPLYTKLVGTDFDFDVVALQADGSIASTYTGTVSVELFDDTTAPASCAAYSSPVTTAQNLVFAAGDNGRKKIGTKINLTKAYSKLRCRATQTLPTTVSGCSSDDFTVRPTAISSVISTDANADASGTSTTNGPVIKTGAGFNLTAGTATVGYNDKPKINPALIEWGGVPAGGRATPGTGQLAGLFTGAANILTGNGALGNAFTYDEVGYFRFKALGVYDDTFTASSNDLAYLDCVPNSASNALDSGKYGCNFGNTVATSYFGRFIPDHFSVVMPVSFSGFCTAGGFIYMDQPFNLVANVEARNTKLNPADYVTKNYSGTFGKGLVTPQMENANSGVAIDITRLNFLTPVWSAGSYAFTADKFKKLAVADGPFDLLNIGLSVSDEAGQVLLRDRDMDASNTSCTADNPGTSSGTCAAKSVATTKVRHGRLKLTSAHGSELLALPVPMKLEYWNGVSGWNTNTLDSCSNFSNTNFSLEFPAGTATKPNNLAACETVVSTPAVAPAQKILLSAPGAGNSGWTNLTLNLASPAGNQCVAVGAAGPVPVSAGMPWLQYNWFGTGLANPKVRATFGVYKNANEFIYLRELH